MPDFMKITTLKLKVRDVFSAKDTVRVIEEWLKENHYVDQEGGEDYETLYTHAIRGGGAVLDAWFWWRVIKYPTGTTKDTAYLRYRINLDMHFLGDANEVEVMHKGKKVKLNKGEIEFNITPIVEIDFRDEWKKSGILGLAHDIFKKKIYKKEIDNHVELLMTDTYKLQNMLKQWFNLESVMPEETVSQPSKGMM